MPNHKKILSNLPRMLLNYESWTAPFEVEVRPSSLPFCQVQFLFSKLDPIETSVGDSFMEQIFVNIGSSTHDVVQTYLGRAGLLYGKWQCKKCYWISSSILGTPYCGDKRLVWERGEDLDKNKIGPEDGPCCRGYATRYKEFAVKDPISGLKGHCDGLILIAGHLYLLEIKTKASGEIVSKLKTPDHTHICQATTYAEMATPRDWGLDQDIEGVAYCYVPRDAPHKMKCIFHPRDASTLESFRKEFPEAVNMLRTGNMENARGVCPDLEYAKKVKYCPYAGQCFRPDRAKFLKRKWKEKPAPKAITRFFDEWRFLSNFYEAEIEYSGIVYPSVEHAYQATKTKDVQHREVISKLSTAREAKKAGRSKALTLRSDWDDIKDRVMARLVYLKFSTHSDLKELLLATGDCHLEEGNNWGDTYWGTVNGQGKNKLGKILMKTRSRLKEEHGSSKPDQSEAPA